MRFEKSHFVIVINFFEILRKFSFYFVPFICHFLSQKHLLNQSCLIIHHLNIYRLYKCSMFNCAR